MFSFSKVTSPERSIGGSIDLRVLSRWAPLPLCLILSRGPETFAVVLHTLGVPMPFLHEIILLYLASLAALVLGGTGSLSIDQWRSNRPVRS